MSKFRARHQFIVRRDFEGPVYHMKPSSWLLQTNESLEKCYHEALAQLESLFVENSKWVAERKQILIKERQLRKQKEEEAKAVELANQKAAEELKTRMNEIRPVVLEKRPRGRPKLLKKTNHAIAERPQRVAVEPLYFLLLTHFRLIR